MQRQKMGFRDYIEALEEERQKIQMFSKELPLSLELVSQAIEAYRQQLSTTTTEYNFHGQSDCSEQTSMEEGPVLEEFIPIKKRASPDCDDEDDEDEQHSHQPKILKENKNSDKKKSDWLRSVQLWNPDPPAKEDLPRKAAVVEVKRNGGAFHPFQREENNNVVKTTNNSYSNTSAGKSASPAPVPAMSSNSGAVTGGGGSKRSEEKEGQGPRKQRRCWSPELHKRFLQALQQLGGPDSATPKQIRELMKVDGLTNDEVKSHLQVRIREFYLNGLVIREFYDGVPRYIFWKALEKKGVRDAYIKAIQDMYEGVTTSVRTSGGETKEFSIRIGLHQGSSLSPYLFNLVLDVITKPIQEEIPKCMLFADDIVLVAETREEINSKLEVWRRTLESKGFRLSRSKTEYMHCEFEKRQVRSNLEVKMGDHIIPKVEKFRYLGSILQRDGEIGGDINHRIQAGWFKWRKATGVICDKKVPNKVKGKFYRTAIRPAILYGSECWAVTGQQEHKVGVAEMRMLRWMSGHTRKDKIRNEHIREKVGVAPIEAKMVENRLRWFGHIQRRPLSAPVRRVDQAIGSPIRRGRGRPKRTLNEVIERDLLVNNISRDLVYERTLWRRLIHVADPT